MAPESLFGAPPSSAEDPISEPAIRQHEESHIVISSTGDLILRVKELEGEDNFAYRVETACLREASSYFEKLLRPAFSEGAAVVASHKALKEEYASLADVPFERLPEVAIEDIGRISKVSTIKNISADFLRVIHDQGLGGKDAPPVTNLANLTIVADRFDALDAFSKHAKRKGYMQMIEAKSKKSSTLLAAGIAEERARQKLMVGILLDYSPWVGLYSKRLIVTDSARWKAQDLDDEESALWWDLPSGIEDELMYRRQCVLETISSLQKHFLKLYTSGQRQCKLGYDSSAQCDSFQLGEMVKFFVKNGTLRLRSAIFGDDPGPDYRGDINRLLDSMKQCPSYQIDNNHAHCGLRARLLPLIDFIQSQTVLSAAGLDMGICTECWLNYRSEYAWSLAKRPLVWSRPMANAGRPSGRVPASGRSCLARHLWVRDMFTAVDHNWTAKE
ncbi:hypothetical protein K490DRAFT_48070 [Saccharata proteae CBS 121410]|uniref:BTB domain-containing protein n=1 Tax=Saccharata proteae CBS 121410 TaxID=1314787 RepID=A0A9P4HQR7_9PEZI|nr:hypothetical protein K490DRAFT_48070 [Saccharata proteae CBS 121410]